MKNNSWNMSKLANKIPFLSYFVLLLITINFMTNEAKATLSGPLYIPYLESKSELIVKGRVIGVQKPTTNGGKRIGEIRVDRVIKGDWKQEIIILSYPPDSVMGPRIDTLKEGQNAVFFLKLGEKGAVPVDASHIMVPIQAGRPLLPDEPTAPLERIREELLFTAATEILDIGQGQKDNVPQAVNNTFDFALMGLPANAVAAQQLGNFPVEERTIALLEKLAVNPNRLLCGAAIESLLKLNQPNALVLARDYLRVSNSPEGLATNAQIQRDAVIHAIQRFKDVKAIDLLGEMLTSNDPKIRISAIRSLRQTGRLLKKPGRPLNQLKEGLTIPYLIKALDDSSPEVRFQTIWALSEITSKPHWFPNFRYQDKDFNPDTEKKIIEQWKEWWRVEGKPLFDAPVQATPKAEPLTITPLNK